MAVVGGGVVGLTCALELARSGHRVQLHTADPPDATTSAVAAAIWFPYRAAPADAVLRWGATSLAAFTRLADDPATGVALRPGTVVHRTPEPDLWWARDVPGHRSATPDEVPPGVRAAPAACSRWSTWAGTCPGWPARAAPRGSSWCAPGWTGWPTSPGTPSSWPRAWPLGRWSATTPGCRCRGRSCGWPTRGLPGWLLDEDDPAGLTYVVPRGHDVVCGGTAVEGATGTDPDPDVEAAVLARVHALVPALRDAPVLSRAVGLRPGRPTVRLERIEVAGRPVVTCYGHGGAGVTLSWGCAADVAGLV